MVGEWRNTQEHKLKLETLETRANQASRLRTNVSEDSEKAAIIASSMKEDEGALQALRDKMDDLQTAQLQIQSLEEDVRGLKAARDMKVSGHASLSPTAAGAAAAIAPTLSM
jgi:ribosomal 50S subunit-associated protein YjgA (DUF615 family)